MLTYAIFAARTMNRLQLNVVMTAPFEIDKKHGSTK